MRIRGERHRGAPRHRGRWAAALTVLVCALVVAACSADGDDSSSDMSESSPGVAEDTSSADSDSFETGSDGGGEGALTATPGVSVAAADRRQVFTASVDLRVDSLDSAVAEGSGAIEALGGFTASENIDLSASLHATVVYRVPSTQFRPALAALSELGELQQQTIDSSDVTAQYADLESRVTTLRTSIERLQGFLGEATDANQIASLESELTRREAELESIEGQRRALADQVELSTITVSFAATSATPEPAEDRPGFRGGLDAGWDVVVAVGAAALATAGFLVPFLPVLVAVGLLVWFLRRRRRSRRSSPPASTPVPGAPTGPTPDDAARAG